MSKRNEEDQPLDDQTDLNSAGEPELPTIEEHKKKLNIDAPVFAAVMQTQKWASGKRVPEADFKKAVEEFLGAPMGGK